MSLPSVQLRIERRIKAQKRRISGTSCYLPSGAYASRLFAAAAAASYVFLIFLFDMLLEFLLVVVALDSICLSTVLVDRMVSLILVILVIICLLFS